MMRIAEGKASLVALFAALVLFMQSVLAAWANVGMPSGPQLDAFGNPLCIASRDANDGYPFGERIDPAGCCTLGCGTALPLLATPDSGNSIFHPLLVLSETLLVSADNVARVAPDHDQGAARAPPLMA